MQKNYKKVGLLFGLALLITGVAPIVASADTVGVDFESPTYSVGNINGQDGWVKTGSYDAAVVSSPVISGSQSLRISNAVTSGSFGDQTFSKSLTDAVGETGAGAGAFSIGTLQPHFEMEFDIKSATTTIEQTGLFLSVSPDRGDGSRMSYLGFADVTGGVNVIFYDVQGTSSPANFVSTDLGTYSRSDAHHIKLTFDAIDGDSNDVVKVWIDSVLVHTGTSWENYYRYDTEASAEQNVRAVRNVLFRAGGPATPGTSGNGFLIDNFSITSGPIVAPVVASGNITSPLDGSTVSGLTNFTASYNDGDVPNTDDAVQWAVREGTCAAGVGTIVGNVDGHSDVATWDGNSFSFSTDTSAWTPGSYCFIFNPTDDVGQPNVRETSNFTVVTPPVLTTPTDKNQCKDGGWTTFNNPTFKNQGECVSYVQANPKAGKR